MANELEINGCIGALIWSLNENTLTIKGVGAMPDFNTSTDAPWDSYRKTIIKVIIEEGVTNIGAGAFFACYNLTSVTIPDSVTKIGGTAFSGCSSLTSLTIPDGVIVIDFAAFCFCTGLRFITIPDNVRRIEDSAFTHCTRLTTVTISNSVTNTEKWAFVDCTNLQHLYLPSENPPAMSHNPFKKMIDTCILHVPIDSKKKYEQAEWWKDFKNIQEHDYFEDYLFTHPIEKMTLPELEQSLETLVSDKNADRDKIDYYLSQRKEKLENMFECTPENVERLHFMANLIKERTTMLYEKGNQLYEQMYKLWKDGQNKPFVDFYIELSLQISFNDETSILHLDDDKTGSNYVRMAEILDDFYFDTYNRSNLILHNRIDFDAEKQKIFKFVDHDSKTDNWGESDFFDLFPELQKLPIVHEFHNLLFHTHYALQDIIRINDVWSEAKVVWQHYQ
ncbi:MAG: leucine-rich repeat domain-containing protein [Bacteroidales bacterium]|jgi:hypothetical protein|nr:leucine-rich repeat domain-containing protein [Bacteroidales bacterium]